LAFIPSISCGADLKGKVIWMDEEEMASYVVPRLENFSKMEEEINVLKEEVINCEKKNDESAQQLSLCNEAKDNITNLLDSQKESYEKIIKESQPSFFKKLGIAGGGTVVGILIGIIIAVAL
jgi:hypothetical protein